MKEYKISTNPKRTALRVEELKDGKPSPLPDLKNTDYFTRRLLIEIRAIAYSEGLTVAQILIDKKSLEEIKLSITMKK